MEFVNHWNWIPGIHQRKSCQDPFRTDGRTIWIWEVLTLTMLTPPFFPEDVFGFKKTSTVNSCETEELDGHIVGDYQQL